MSIFVVDASVAVKWFVDENHSEAARRLQTSSHQFHVPGFFDVEVCGVFWKKVRRGDLVAELQSLSFTRHSDQVLASEAFEIALATGRSVYDSVYLALAVRLRCRVATADERLKNALLGTRWEQHILWVEDIP